MENYKTLPLRKNAKDYYIYDQGTLKMALDTEILSLFRLEIGIMTTGSSKKIIELVKMAKISLFKLEAMGRAFYAKLGDPRSLRPLIPIEDMTTEYLSAGFLHYLRDMMEYMFWVEMYPDKVKHDERKQEICKVAKECLALLNRGVRHLS